MASGESPGESKATQAKSLPKEAGKRGSKQYGKKVKFTVTPVSAEVVSENSPTKPPSLTLDLSDGDEENTDSLNQSSITALLSSKFREVSKTIKRYSSPPPDSPHYRKRLVSKWESLNYEIWENEISLKEVENTTKQEVRKIWLSRWFAMLVTGIGTALVALTIQIFVEHGTQYKFELIKHFFDHCINRNCMYAPALIWIGINAVLSVIGAALVTYIAPKAAGSGIPLIKAYLNGVKIPGLLRFRTLVAKVVGVILSLLGGLLCGKEGPMVHSGAIVAAGFGRGRLPFCNFEFKIFFILNINISAQWVTQPVQAWKQIFEHLRSDHEIRDLVSAGAAAGVSAAFGAPVGGTLFSVEEAATFWNPELTWRVFFSAMMAIFFTNFFLSAAHGHPTKLSSAGLVRFDLFKDELSFDLVEFPIFFVIGIIGGLIGALFVIINYKLTVFRYRYMRKKFMMLIDAGLVSVVTGLVGFLMIYTINDCTEIHPYEKHATITKAFCTKENQHSAPSSLLLSSPEATLKGLLHDPPGSYSVGTLAIFLIVFFFLSVWTYGLNISSGVFIPSLAIGAAWGRMIGMGMMHVFPNLDNNLGKYALLGAAAQLGGIVRTTISIMVILVECTGNITLGLPLMVILIVSKWVGDFISTGLYEMNVHVAGIPMLPCEPPPLFDGVKACDVMCKPPIVISPVEKVSYIVDLLKGETSCGFPVVDFTDKDNSPNKLKGLILKSQLLVLLKHKIFAAEGSEQPAALKSHAFRDFYNFQWEISKIPLSDSDRNCMMDLRKYMAVHPHTVHLTCSLPRLFRLFQGLGLRHLIVVNNNNEVVGMITRKDLAKFRAEAKRGLIQIETLEITDI